MDEKSSAENISDVARPGQTAATPTSKPVITGHGLLSADPFLQPKAADLLLENQKKELPLGKQKTLSPSEGFKPDAEDQAADDPQISPGQAAKDKPKPVTSEEERAEQERLAKLVADKTYFLPVGSVAKRHGNLIAVVLGVVVVFAAAVFYLMNK